METWVDYKGGYQVSDLGRVRGKRGNVLKQEYNIRGYKRVQIYIDGQRRRMLVHRLVWRMFKGAIPYGYVVDHKDNLKFNNRLDNLQLLTYSDNTQKYYSEDRYKIAA